MLQEHLRRREQNTKAPGGGMPAFMGWAEEEWTVKESVSKASEIKGVEMPEVSGHCGK